MATELTAARLLVYRAAWAADHGAERVTLEAAMAKAFATEAAQRIVDDAVQILGGAGLLRAHPVDRLYRSVRALRIYEGTTEIQHLVIADALLKEADGMKAVCIGGGPAGLFFAILLKKADPRHEVLVYERNRLDDTFGFGVVFSDATEEALAHADPEVIEAMAARCHRWDDIEVHYRGETLTSSGHGFSGLSRKALLQILADRCREVGVKLCFEREVTDPEQVRDADLVVAADGVNSTVRERYREHFRPTVDVRPNRFVWLGTTRPFPGVHLLLQGRSRTGCGGFTPTSTSATHSTFIVEAREETWRAAGLERADEAGTIAFCERLFADELDGHRLLSEPLDLAELPDHSKRALAARERGAGGRRRAHRALLGRLGHQARDGGRDRAGRCARPARRRSRGARRLRGGAAPRGREPAARGAGDASSGSRTPSAT